MAYRNTNHFYKNKIPKGFDLLDDSFVLDVANFMQVENKDEIKKLQTDARMQGNKFFNYKGKRFPIKIDPDVVIKLVMSLNEEILNEAIQKFGGTIQTKPGVEEEPPKVLDETDIEFAELLIDNLQKLEGRESIDKYNDIAEKYRTTKSIRGRKALLDRFKKLLNPGPTLVE